jgi:hypothetical protein
MGRHKLLAVLSILVVILMALSTIPAVTSDSSSGGGARQDNIAPKATGSSSGGGSGSYGPANMNDLNTANMHWVSTGSGGSSTAYFQLTWTQSYTIGKMKVIQHGAWSNSGNRNLAGCDVQYWDGSKWVTDKTLSGLNSDFEHEFVNTPTTDRIRMHNLKVTGSQSSNPCVYEWYVYEGAALEAKVEVKPSNLHFNSNAKYLNVRITDFPDDPDKSPVDIDGSTVTVQGFGTIPKYDKNVDSKYMGKVDRQIILDAIGTPGEQIELSIRGNLYDGTPFSGKCYVRAS